MAETISFEELVASRLLNVPDYQRGYAWDLRQLTEFWEDIDLIEPGGRHYTGTVVLQSTGGAVVDDVRGVPLDEFDVVDGQQRLTTCIILLDILLDRLEAFDDPDAGSNRRRLLTATVGGVPRPKLQLSGDIRDYWQHAVLDGKPFVDDASLASRRRLRRAVDFFNARLDAMCNGVTDDEFTRRLRRVVGKVAGSLQFTLYVAGDEAEVGVIFETLNQRGKALTELEKTKNYLLFLASRLPAGQRAQLSQEINETWRAIFTNLGQLPPDHEDQFLRAHWLATQNPAQRDWERINSVKERFHRRNYVDSPQLLFDEVSAYVRSLQQASAAYRDVMASGSTSFAEFGSLAPTVRTWSNNLRQAGVIQIFTPVLIAARLKFPSSGDSYLALVQQCERYSARVFMIMERRANAGQARLYSLAKLLHDSGDVAATLRGMSEQIVYYASDVELEADLRNVRRNWYAKPGHKYFLYQYELHLLDGDQPTLSFDHFTGDHRSSTTEHILPQHPNDPCWTELFTKTDRDELTHSLGNLVLTYDNSSYGNRCFATKRDGASGNTSSACYRRSVMRQEQEISLLPTWDSTAISERQSRLADWALKRWAVPDAPAPSDLTAVDTSEDDQEPEATSDEGLTADSELPTDPA
jgi:hypothetical protein